MNTNCNHLSGFMRIQIDIIKKHIDEHKFLRHMEDKNEALESFIHDYGWLIRELYCTRICELQNDCEIAMQLSKSGDLLSHHTKSLCPCG